MAMCNVQNINVFLDKKPRQQRVQYTKCTILYMRSQHRSCAFVCNIQMRSDKKPMQQEGICLCGMYKIQTCIQIRNPGIVGRLLCNVQLCIGRANIVVVHLCATYKCTDKKPIQQEYKPLCAMYKIQTCIQIRNPGSSEASTQYTTVHGMSEPTQQLCACVQHTNVYR